MATKPLHHNVEILGQVIIDFENAIGGTQFLPILQKHGLDQVQPDKWYSGQDWLNVLTEITADSGSYNLVSIGMEQIKLVDWPPEFYEMPMEEVLQSLNPVYQSYYRGPDIGEITIEKVTDSHLKVILRVFEPDDLWYGNIYQIIKTFNNDVGAVMWFDDEHTRKDQGGENTIIHIDLSQ